MRSTDAAQTHTQQTHTGTHDDSIRRNEMRCISPKNHIIIIIIINNNNYYYYYVIITIIINLYSPQSGRKQTKKIQEVKLTVSTD